MGRSPFNDILRIRLLWTVSVGLIISTYLFIYKQAETVDVQTKTAAISSEYSDSFSVRSMTSAPYHSNISTQLASGAEQDRSQDHSVCVEMHSRRSSCYLQNSVYTGGKYREVVVGNDLHRLDENITRTSKCRILRAHISVLSSHL